MAGAGGGVGMHVWHDPRSLEKWKQVSKDPSAMSTQETSQWVLGSHCRPHTGVRRTFCVLRSAHTNAEVGPATYDTSQDNQMTVPWYMDALIVPQTLQLVQLIN